jgi:hypothetical protein
MEETQRTIQEKKRYVLGWESVYADADIDCETNAVKRGTEQSLLQAVSSFQAVFS